MDSTIVTHHGADTLNEYLFDDSKGKANISKNLAISAYSTYTNVIEDALKQSQSRYEALGLILRENWQSDV